MARTIGLIPKEELHPKFEKLEPEKVESSEPEKIKDSKPPKKGK